MQIVQNQRQFLYSYDRRAGGGKNKNKNKKNCPLSQRSDWWVSLVTMSLWVCVNVCGKGGDERGIMRGRQMVRKAWKRNLRSVRMWTRGAAAASSWCNRCLRAQVYVSAKLGGVSCLFSPPGGLRSAVWSLNICICNVEKKKQIRPPKIYALPLLIDSTGA